MSIVLYILPVFLIAAVTYLKIKFPELKGRYGERLVQNKLKKLNEP